MKYLSVCSGIEAATVAWRPLGWRAFAYSEIERFPCAVLAHHYPDTPNLGDMTRFQEWPDADIDVLVGGTPCQSFSVAGLRKGLDDPRGNLMLTYGAIAGRYRPRWLVWENVPGVLSSNGGRGFGTFLGMLAELGYGFAYRILDAQYFGVAQRRRRVFVVGYLGDWRRAAAVLFERESLCGHPAPSRKAGKAVAALATNGVGTCGVDDNQGQAGHLIHCEAISRSLTACNTATGRLDPNEMEFIATSLSESPIAFSCKDHGADAGGVSPTLRSMGHDGSHANGGGQVAVAFAHQAGGIQTTLGYDPEAGTSPTLAKCQTPAIDTGMAVRRLTPTECERLQGFPDGYTDIRPRGKPTPDGPRYKALGNSFAVPVVRWLGERIAAVDAIKAKREAA